MTLVEILEDSLYVNIEYIVSIFYNLENGVKTYYIKVKDTTRYKISEEVYNKLIEDSILI